MRPSSNRSQRGFSLLEVIIAFALLALSLSLLMSAMGDALGNVRWAAQDQRALSLSQSHLDQVGRFGSIALGETEGEWEDGAFRYVEKVRLVPDPMPLPEAPPTQTLTPPAQVLVRIELDVRWGSGEGRERLSLTTLRLRSAAEYPDVDLSAVNLPDAELPR